MRKIYYYVFVTSFLAVFGLPKYSNGQSAAITDIIQQNGEKVLPKGQQTKQREQQLKFVKKPIRTLNEYLCDIDNPIPESESLTIIVDTYGFAVGTNVFGDKQKANFYDLSSYPYTELTHVIFGAYVEVPDSSKSVTVRVFDGSSGAPGTELGSKPVTLKALADSFDLNEYVYLEFDTPIPLPVSKKIFISVDFSNLSIDLPNNEFFGLISTDFGAPDNLAWEQWEDNSWHSFAEVSNFTWSDSVIIEMYPVICGDIPLPITLNSFSANSFGSANKIIWETQTESNNKGFEIQRSEDGVNFTTIAFVASNAANGNSSARIAYSFIDESPAATNYYRIKQVDINQKINFSKVLLVNRSGLRKQGILSFYPNPTKDLLNLVLDLPAGKSNTVSITDMVGRTLMQKKVEGSNTNLNLQFNVSSLPKGTYLVKSQNGEGLSLVKFVKE